MYFCPCLHFDFSHLWIWIFSNLDIESCQLLLCLRPYLPAFKMEVMSLIEGVTRSPSELSSDYEEEKNKHPLSMIEHVDIFVRLKGWSSNLKTKAKMILQEIYLFVGGNICYVRGWKGQQRLALLIFKIHRCIVCPL